MAMEVDQEVVELQVAMQDIPIPAIKAFMKCRHGCDHSGEPFSGRVFRSVLPLQNVEKRPTRQ
jgi:hypothetical protein